MHTCGERRARGLAIAVTAAITPTTVMTLGVRFR
jgi:hypothetical protein